MLNSLNQLGGPLTVAQRNIILSTLGINLSLPHTGAPTSYVAGTAPTKAVDFGDDIVTFSMQLPSTADGLLSLVDPEAASSPLSMVEDQNTKTTTVFLETNGDDVIVSTVAELLTLLDSSALLSYTLDAGTGTDVLTAQDIVLENGVDEVLGTLALPGRVATDGTSYWVAVKNNLTGRVADTWESFTPTVVGRSIQTIASPSAIRYIRINADNTLTLQSLTELHDDLGLASVDPLFAEFYMYENTAVVGIDKADTYHGVIGSTTGILSGFTYKAGVVGTFSAVADGTDGKCLITAGGAHGLVAGDIVNIVTTGATTYDGAYVVSIPVANPTTTFYITKAFSITKAGTWERGCSLKASVGSAGAYTIGFNATLWSASANQIIKLEANKNTTPLDNTACSQHYVSVGSATSQHENMSSDGYVNIADGDILWLSAKNVTSTGDFTIRHCNFHLHKL